MAENPVITCPECNKKFKAKGDLQGKKVRCPFCKEAFSVGGDRAAAAAPAKAKAAAAAAADSANPPDDIDPYKASDQDLRPRCPNCANEMANKDATICLFCGYNTLTREWGKTVKTVGHTPGQILLHLLPGLLVLSFILCMLMFMLYYCLVLPNQVADSWLWFLDAESLRMWLAIIGMGVVWGSGMYCYKRFFIEPLPPEIKVE
jgi:DNA-directed RNA polymerase subunit RPC12/RpoP